MEPRHRTQTRRLARIAAGLATLAIAGAALSACGLPIGAGNCTPKGGTGGTGGTTINVVSDPQTTGTYQPKDVTIQAKQSVTWTWQDQGNRHSVTADNGSFDSCLQSAGYTFMTSFATPGTYSYKCSIHPQMTGRITVT